MAEFTLDTFTDSDGATLDGHTPDSGGSWTKHVSHASGAASISDVNRVRNAATAETTYYHSGIPASNEYDVEADFVVVTDVNGAGGGVYGRLATTDLTGYLVEHSMASDVWELYKVEAGSYTSLGSFSQTLATQAYALKLQILDASKKVFVDDVERISSSDNVIGSAGKAGIWLYSGSAPSNSTGPHLDNFVGNDQAPPPPEVTDWFYLVPKQLQVG